MIEVRRSAERGTTKLDWLDSRHTFSFGDYFDPEHMRFGTLRVINEDWVSPRSGFGSHPHRDMEIITYVLEGALEHKDTTGTGSTIRPGDVQQMSAGTGIMHSEYNLQNDTSVHLLQIWIIPQTKNLPPSYEQKNFSKHRQPGKLTLLASQGGRDDSLTIHQDASLFVLDLEREKAFTYALAEERQAWIQIARGDIMLNGQLLKEGDGAGVSHENSLEFLAKEKAEILIFDLPR